MTAMQLLQFYFYLGGTCLLVFLPTFGLIVAASWVLDRLMGKT